MHFTYPGRILDLDLAFRPHQAANFYDKKHMLTRWQTINGPLCPKKPGDQATISWMIDSALKVSIERASLLTHDYTSPLNSLCTPCYITPQEHYHSLTKGSAPAGLDESRKPTQRQKPPFPSMAAFMLAKGPGRKLLITRRWPQGDIVQVDHAHLPRLIGLKGENQFLHVCEGG